LSGAVHAGLIALATPAGWRGVLIEGPSGAGKSDLALRALDYGFRLVADDRVLLWVSGGALFGRAPGSLHGLIEVRGLGIRPAAALAFSRVDLVVECVAADKVERLPDAAFAQRAGISVPLMRLWPFEPAAPAKLRGALAHL
jgi:serine kinase of HPr protein (carbohydrate metabolism regulator)